MGIYISSQKLINEYNQDNNYFNCDCEACNDLKERNDMTIPEMEIRRIQAYKSGASPNKALIGISNQRQTEYVKLHNLINWVKINRMDDTEFNNKGKNWERNAQWIKVKKDIIG